MANRRSNIVWRFSAVLIAFGLVGAGGLAIANHERIAQLFSHDDPSDAHHSSGGHGDDCHDDHGHSDEPTVATTIWAEYVDVFLERPYPVVGEPFEMLVHVTVIHNGAPISEGSLGVELGGSNEELLRFTAETPARAGIFIPAITVPHPGTYAARLIVEASQVPGGSEAIELPPISVYASAEDALAAHEHANEEEAENEITYLKEQQWRVGLTTAQVQERKLVERLVVPGRVIAPPGAGAVVSSPVAGTVSPPDDRFVQIGQFVEIGQVLAVVDPAIAGSDAVELVANQAQLQSLDADLVIKQLDLETQIQKAELAVARTKEIFDRKSGLAGQGVVPGKDLLLAKHELAVAERQLSGLAELRHPYANARHKLATVLSGMKASGDVGQQPGDLRVTLRSPIAGTAVEISTTSGELARENQLLFRILNLDRLWIEADVSEYDLAKVQQAPGASYRLAAYPDKTVSIIENGGRLVDIGAEIDVDTRTVPIRYEVTNRDRLLRVGMFAELLLETQRSQNALSVPAIAVLDEAGETVVYVQSSGEAFERRHVQIGIRDADFVEIIQGLSAGERVATKGAYSVKLATLSKQTIGHGHAH